MYTIESFLNGEFIINCKTEDEANEFLKILRKYNVCWNSGCELDCNNRFNRYKEETCYDCIINVCFKEMHRLSYGHYDFYRKYCNNVPIIPFKNLCYDTSHEYHKKKQLIKLLLGG